jgi:hypothetical protein
MIRCFASRVLPPTVALYATTRALKQPCVLSGNALRHLKTVIAQNGLDHEFQKISATLKDLQNSCPPADRYNGCRIGAIEIPPVQKHAITLNTQITSTRKSLEKILAEDHPWSDEMNPFTNADRILDSAQHYVREILEAGPHHDLYLSSSAHYSLEKMHHLNTKIQKLLLESVWRGNRHLA